MLVAIVDGGGGGGGARRFLTGDVGREALGWGPPADWGPKAIA